MANTSWMGGSAAIPDKYVDEIRKKPIVESLAEDIVASNQMGLHTH